MKMIIVLLLAFSLNSCAWGVTRIKVKKRQDGSGTISISTGKQYKKVVFGFSKSEKGITSMVFIIDGVEAFDGQKLSADAIKEGAKSVTKALKKYGTPLAILP